MTDYAIQAENLGKRYFLGETGGRNYVRQAVKSLLPNSQQSHFQEFWALRNVSFAIRHGEAIGVIGRNGAGKSTLLKLLSRVAAPSEGRARVRGRVGTLLEVGTGFHPELTGRDNIFLSGTILGMTYREVSQKFDEIVTFSEIERFIDTPVKRYSSGMYVRLAFAVAAFLEPEILIVDEVLAVGDAAFQRKSLGRLNEVSDRDGRTVLFVSHNLAAIRTFCKRVIVLDKGRLIFDGNVQDGLEAYLQATPTRLKIEAAGLKDRLNRTSGAVRFTEIVPENSRGDITWKFKQGQTITMKFRYNVVDAVPNLAFLVQLRSALDGQVITTIRRSIVAHPLKPGMSGQVVLTLPDVPLRPSEFSIYAGLCRIDDVVYYDIIDANVDIPLLAIDSDSDDKYERQGVVDLVHHISPSPILVE